MLMKAGHYPPGPRHKLPGSLLLQLRRDPLKMSTELAREYGDIVHLKIFFRHTYMLYDPNHIKDVLVTHNRNFTKPSFIKFLRSVLGEGLLTSEGEFHDRQRRLVQHAFHRERIAKYADIMADHAARMAGRWRDGSELDMHKEMMRLTLGIVGKTLFDVEIEEQAGEIRDALTIILVHMNSAITNPVVTLLEKIPLPSTRRWVRARKKLDDTIYQIINERRKSGEDHGDLLSMLIQAQDAEGGSGGMTDLQVHDEAMTLFLAGHETTANALTWSLYLLSQNPEVEEKLHQEVDSVLGGRLPTLEDVPRLPYTEMVLTESLRLYPPLHATARENINEYAVADYSIAPHSIIVISPYVMQHDPRYYNDPERFLPERWSREFKAKLPRFAYFPFGGGPRGCVGESFAWTEGIIILSTLAQRWQMRLAPGQIVAPKVLLALRPKYGMRMILERREAAA